MTYPAGLGSTFGAMETGLEHIHDSFGPTLAQLAGEGRYAVVSGTVFAPRDVPERDDPTFELAFAVDPRVSEAVQVADGRAPGPPPDGPIVEGTTVEIWLSVAGCRGDGMGGR